MFCGMQLGLAGVGLWWMAAKVLPVGRYEVRRPHTFFVGLILLLQLPITAGTLFAAGAAEGYKAAVAGQDSPNAKLVHKKYAWIEWAVPGAAVVLAGVVGVMSLRPVEYDDPFPVETVGVRNLVRERQEQEDAERRNQQERDDIDQDDKPEYHRTRRLF